MCTYNGSKYLPEQLESFALQSRLPDELVICDDLSTDDTSRIINAFAEGALFKVRFYQNDKNLGSTKNFEKAIGLCSGDIIVLSDQDDVWTLDKLKIIEKTFYDRMDVGAIFSNADVVDSQLDPLGYELWDAVRFSKNERCIFVNGRQVNVLLKHNVVTGATMAFRASFKRQVLPIPKIWIHDAWIAFIISLFSEIAPINEPLIKYRQYSGQQIGMDNINLSTTISMFLRYSIFHSKISHIIDGTKKYRAQEADRYKLALERYVQITGSIDKNLLFLMNKKISHSEFRITLPNYRILRIPLILKELMLLRYARYSHRQIYALIDFIF